MDNKCICCDAIIPEGIQVCPACEEKSLCIHYDKEYCRITNAKCMGNICALYGGRRVPNNDCIRIKGAGTKEN